jgi:hypothetical protein
MPKNECYSVGCANDPAYHLYLMKGCYCYNWQRFCKEHIEPAKESYSDIFEVHVKSDKEFEKTLRMLNGF